MYEGSLTLTGTSCTEIAKKSLEQLLGEALQTSGLCVPPGCWPDSVQWQTDCNISGKAKRSTEPVLFTVKFNFENRE